MARYSKHTFKSNAELKNYKNFFQRPISWKLNFRLCVLPARALRGAAPRGRKVNHAVQYIHRNIIKVA